MEGPQGLKFDRQTIGIIIVILFHAVGLVGFYGHSLQPLFLKLVPWHILLMLVVISFTHRSAELKFFLFVVLIIALGYAVEWRGINKHTLFGQYSYGPTLGIMYDDVPLIIGVNWLILLYATGVSMRYIIPNYMAPRIVAGALVMVFMDLLIEPIAVKFNYWHWEVFNSTLTAPTSNYIDWFFVSLVMMVLFEFFLFKKQNWVGVALLATQFVFFILMRWA